MNTKKGLLVLAAALLLCSAQLLFVAQVSASENVTDEQGLSLQAPPPPPPGDPPPGPPPSEPPPGPPPPTPPSPPEPPYPPTPPSPHGWDHPGYPGYPGYHYPYTDHWPYGWRWPYWVSGRVIVVSPPYQSYQPVVYAPVINSFTANPSYIQSGQGILLTWTTTNATTVTLSPGIGSVPTSGSYNLSPGYTTTYTLSATNSGGSVSASTTVTVAPYVYSYPSSSAPVASTVTVADTDTGSILTGGLSGISGNPAMLITLLGLLAVAAAVAVILLVRRPAVAPANGNSRRAGYLATATRTASRTPSTTPADAGPRLTMSNGELIPLSGKSGALGRGDFSSLLKADEADLISRRHLRFDCEDGECYIEDRNSTNGTRLNGSSINGKGRYLLREGDKVELADTITLTFKP
jgi:hypothetical protein